MYDERHSLACCLARFIYLFSFLLFFCCRCSSMVFILYHCHLHSIIIITTNHHHHHHHHHLSWLFFVIRLAAHRAPIITSRRPLTLAAQPDFIRMSASSLNSSIGWLVILSSSSF